MIRGPLVDNVYLIYRVNSAWQCLGNGQDWVKSHHLETHVALFKSASARSCTLVDGGHIASWQLAQQQLLCSWGLNGRVHTEDDAGPRTLFVNLFPEPKHRLQTIYRRLRSINKNLCPRFVQWYWWKGNSYKQDLLVNIYSFLCLSYILI